MVNLKHFQTVLEKDWYIQGFNAVPLFLNVSAWSGIAMKKELGFGYTAFLHNYHDGYCEMGYLNSDFKRIWNIVKRRLSKDSFYLKKVKKRYEYIFKDHEKLFKKIDKLALKKINDEEFLIFFKKCAQALTDSVGIAHIVDAVGIEIETEFKERLFKEIKDKNNFNQYFSQLTAPSKSSFIKQEEKELLKIANFKGSKRKKGLRSHLNKYFWIQNSYAGPNNPSISSLNKRLGALKSHGTSGISGKNNLIRKLNLSKKTKRIIEIIDFTTIFQDERKRNAIKTIGYFGKIINEVGRRTKISTKSLYYLSLADVNNLNSISDFKNLNKELKNRASGTFSLMDKNGEFSVFGSQYKKLINFRKKLNQDHNHKQEDIHGSIANPGTAIGKAVIIKGMASLNRVQKGDIIVASMTRPEFMPALKKAAAIVTDEGGVTCHAAIISRELNIPAVIGTKMATKILKNGVMVEVRANHGIIRIIK